jgi:hypothetical protein
LWTECGCRRGTIDPREYYVDNGCKEDADCEYDGCDTLSGSYGDEAPTCFGLPDGDDSYDRRLQSGSSGDSYNSAGSYDSEPVGTCKMAKRSDGERWDETCPARPVQGYGYGGSSIRRLDEYSSAATTPKPFDLDSAPGLERMKDYLCPCAERSGAGSCHSNILCVGDNMNFAVSVCSNWCRLAKEKCPGYLILSPSGDRTEWRCAIGTDKCSEDVDKDTFAGFVYVTMDDYDRCQPTGPVCKDGSTLRMSSCSAPEGQGGQRRMLLEEVLFVTGEGEREYFEADVALLGMDAPVADT